ncbi:Cfap46p [Tritrichomonas musculus]|uniref:Cfap46p n=1 Tax=Tritrichomonas musculus TaxID=1915356 RepID=A0ABR2HW50_9EUKA
MEQSLRLLLTEGTKLNEQTLLNVYNKLNAPGNNFASDLYILTAENFFDLPPPLQKHIIDKAENMITIYNRLQEPTSQFQIRGLICQSLINSYRARQQRGIPATELNLKAIDFMLRALKLIQSNSLYQPLALRAVFLFYQIAFPFFILEQRHHLSQITPIALSLLETHLTGKFDANLRLYIAISLLYGCILDDFNKVDDAAKQMGKLFTFVPTDLLQLRYSLLHYYTHFSRKSTGGLIKQKLDLNEQLQKAVVMYQTARSNNATATKDLAEVLKICLAFLENKKEANEETFVAEIIIGETGRLAAQFGQTQIAEECQAKSASARSQIARLHSTLISAELALKSNPTPVERSEIINNCNHIMSLAMYQGDLVTVHDAAAMLWTHSIQIMDSPHLIKRYILSTCDILAKINSQANILRSQMHFALAKIFEAEHDNMKAIDNLKKALALDYLWVDHPTKLIHPFDRFLIPYFRMLSVSIDSYGQQESGPDEAFSLIALPKKINPKSLEEAYNILLKVAPTNISSYDAIDASHYSNVWLEIIKNASNYGCHEIAAEGCHSFLAIEFETIQFDSAVELQCESTVYGITSCFKLKPENITYAIEFVNFSIERSKILKKNRLAYNSISSIWNSFFSLQNPEDCGDYADFLFELVNHLFESDFPNSKNLVGQIVNFYVKVILLSNSEQQHQNSSSVKKKGQSLDATKQKQLKTAEDIIIKSFSIVSSIYEKKALIDRLVDIFGKRNQLPPNQNDPELSILVTLATIMNEKVQHKPETLTSVYNQILSIKQPALFALLAEKACKLDLHQITIDSASKAIELMPNPSNKDEKYHMALARFYRGLAFLKIIQPDLQEFSCQDKLRSDSAADFLRAAVFFTDAKSTENAKTAMSYFISTISVGENYPKFRELLSDLLVEAISISRKIVIGDDLKVRLYRIYLLVLIDRKDFVTCRKTIKSAITTLNKSVHCDIWDLNLIVTFNADCEKSQQPLLDEMLRVKQLGDSTYQSKLWTFVADLATDQNIQRTALNKALDVLKKDDFELKFQANMNYAHWLFDNDFSWEEIEKAVSSAEKAIVDDEAQPERALEHRFEVVAFQLTATPSFEVFDQARDMVDNLGTSLWDLTVRSNNATEEDEGSSLSKRSASKNKSSSHKLLQSAKPEDFNSNPSSINDWIQLMQQVETHKTIQLAEPFKFVQNLLLIIDVLENVGYEYFLLKIWYHVLLVSGHLVQWPRFEQYLLMKLKIFLDKLNVVSPFVYSNDFILTEEEKSEWTQKVGRYQTDPPSKFPPLRKLLNKQASLLVRLGEYRSALYLINSALNQADQLNDKVTSSESIQMIATIKSRSGDSQGAIDMLSKSNQNIKMPIEFWVEWYSTAFAVQSNSSDFVENLVIAFQQNCLTDKILSIKELISVYKLYRNAAASLSPEGAYDLYENLLKGNLANLKTFIPSIDTTLVFYWRSLLSPKFPKSIVHYRTFGYEVIEIINACSDNYNNILDDKGDEAALPLLCRFVDIVNIFGYLVLKYAPVIRSIEQNGLDINLTGTNESLLSEFIDKSQEPLADLSPTAAVLHFDNVKNNDYIPLKYAVKMNVYLGQCLHAISTENVTLQSSVRYLWKGISLLTDLKEYSLTGEIAQELFSILRSSDISGAIYQFLIAQSVKAYSMRISMLQTDYPPTNRERLFVNENQRLRDAFMNPEISQMFVSSQKYFETIPNGTTLVRLGRKMEEIRNWVTNNRNCMILIIDHVTNESEGLSTSIITLGTPDKFDNVPIEIDFDEVAMKFDIFKQIISTTKTEPTNTEPTTPKGNSPPNSRGKGAKSKRTASKVASAAAPKSELKDTNFAKEALKLNNPEFQKFIEDLCTAFEPLKSVLPDEHSDTILILSSHKNVHSIPFDCISAFDSFSTIYRDFSIMSALNRNSPCTEPPTFGPSD